MEWTNYEALRAAREAAGLSKAELARRMGGKTSEESIRAWETGRTIPRADNWFRFLAACEEARDE